MAFLKQKKPPVSHIITTIVFQVVEDSQPREEDNLLSGNPIDMQCEEHRCDVYV